MAVCGTRKCLRASTSEQADILIWRAAQVTLYVSDSAVFAKTRVLWALFGVIILDVTLSVVTTSAVFSGPHPAAPSSSSLRDETLDRGAEQKSLRIGPVGVDHPSAAEVEYRVCSPPFSADCCAVKPVRCNDSSERAVESERRPSMRGCARFSNRTFVSRTRTRPT